MKSMANAKNFNQGLKFFGCVLFLILFVIGCSLFDEHLKVIKKAEDVANSWDDGKFGEIYVDPSDFEKVKSFRENNFNILRTACEGKIYFKILNKKLIGEDKVDVNIGMYCNGAVDFRKAGRGYENAVRQEAKKDNLLDNAKVILAKKDGKWLVEDFDW